MNKNQLHRIGFTLLELMIVIAILGVLAALISGNFITSLKKGRDARRKADLEQVQKAVEMYYEDKKAYPASITFTGASQITDAISGKIYMQRVPGDPKYKYVLSGIGDSYWLYACLENNQQILPYNSITGTSQPTCTVPCKYNNGTTASQCIWSISSTNTTP